MEQKNDHTQEGLDHPDLPEGDAAASAEEVLTPWFIPLDEFLQRDDTPTEIDYIVEGVLERGGVTIIAGMPETGKSMLTDDMALASVCGQTFMGQRTQEAKWIFMDLEMGKANMAVRMLGLLAGRGIEPDAPCLSNLLVPDYDTMPRDGLIHPDIIEGLILRLGGCDVLVIDSLAKALGQQADEDKAHHIGVLMQNLRAVRDRVGCAVIFVHHVKKNEEGQSIASLRGSSAIGGEPDVVLVCRTHPKGYREITHEKLRSESEDKKWRYRRFDIVTPDAGGIMIESPEPDVPDGVTVAMPETPDAGDPLDDLKNEIITFLRDTGGWVLTGDIYNAVRGKGERKVKALYELLDAGDIQKKEEGRSRWYSFEAF